MDEPKKIPGYVRCGVYHEGAEWRFEALGELAGYVAIQTADGTVEVPLRVEDARRLMRSLQLFVEKFPGGNAPQ